MTKLERAAYQDAMDEAIEDSQVAREIALASDKDLIREVAIPISDDMTLIVKITREKYNGV